MTNVRVIGSLEDKVDKEAVHVEREGEMDENTAILATPVHVSSKRPRRKRSGKKRKLADNCGEWDSDCDGFSYRCPSRVLKRKSRRNCLRPYSPMAPMNSTQFLMDDHENCHLYLSFETARTTIDLAASPNTSFTSEDDYSSPDDSTTFEYIEQDFEDTYRGIREDQLCQKTKAELVKELYFMEKKVVELEKKLKETSLNSELACLISEFQELRNQNLHLKQNINLMSR